MLKRHKGFIILLLVGIIFRILLVFWSVQFRPHPDVLRYADWARISFLYGFSDSYKPDHLAFGMYPNNQPPGSVFVLSMAYWGWMQIGKVLAQFGVSPGSNSWVNTVLLTILLRIPSVLCDFGITLLIYGMVRSKKALLASSLFLFNPVVLYNSAVWGQMDAINNFFFILALYLFILKENSASIIFFAFSLLTKLSLIIMAPVMALLVWLKEKSVKNILFYLFTFLFTVFVSILSISSIPWVWFGIFMTKNATGEMTNVTAFAFNVWWVVFHPTLVFGPNSDAFDVANISLKNSPLVETMYGSISLVTIAMFLTFVCSAIVYYIWYIRFGKEKTLQVVNILRLVASIAIISFLIFPKMHERYLYPAWAPLSLLVGFGIPVLYELLLLTALNFINLLIVWHPMPLPWWVYDLMRSVNFQWFIALLTVIVGIWTIRKLLRKLYL